MRIAQEEGVTTILDPAPAQVLSSDFLRHVDLLTPNESEACLLLDRKLGRITPKEASEVAIALMALGPKAVVLKLGDQGSFYCSQQDEIYCPAFPVESVDSTAAGDVFNAALAVGLAEQRTLDGALRFANAAAAISVTRLGAQSSIPTRAEVEEFLNG
jgi:ribokinase